jgi:hypothetical protein
MAIVPEVPFSELINRPKATTAKLAASQGRELRLRRRDDDDLVLREADADRRRTEMVNIAGRFLRALVKGGGEGQRVARGLASEVFPWVRFLPPSDLDGFLDELAETLTALEDLDTNAPVFTLVTQWRHTAEVYADEGAFKDLTRTPDPEADFGPVPPPEGLG